MRILERKKTKNLILLVGLLATIGMTPSSARASLIEFCQRKVLQVQHWIGLAPQPSHWVQAPIAVSPTWWQEILNKPNFTELSEVQLVGGGTTPIGSYLSSGTFGHVFCANAACLEVVKLPTLRSLSEPQSFQAEPQSAAEFARAGFRVAAIRIASLQSPVPYIVKEYVNGPTFAEVQKSGFNHKQIDDLARIYVTGLRSGVHPDLLGSKKENLIWSRREKRWVIIDYGMERAPAMFRPFGEVFIAGREIFTTIVYYHENFFARRNEATSRFERTARALLSQQ